MKSNGGFVSPLPPKRRWKCFITAVLSLVCLSMFAPLFFLLGFHNGFQNAHISALAAERLNPVSNHLNVPAQHKIAGTENQPKSSSFVPLLKVHGSELEDGVPRKISQNSARHFGNDAEKEILNNTVGNPTPTSFPEQNNRHHAQAMGSKKMVVVNESEVMCQIKFGTYCLWRREQREEMDDYLVKKMKDLLFVARAYYPSIAKLPKFDILSQEMKQNIQEFERILSEASTDKDLPPNNEPKVSMMEATISKAKSCPVDCNNVDKKFRQLVDLAEDEANFHMKQSAFLYKLAVQTMPKSLHCLSMRLTVEYFRSSSNIDEQIERFLNPNMHHCVIFSRNILASSVVVNSTVLHARESGKLVFHILTDKENYFAMKFWFFKNKYGEAAVQVLNTDDSTLSGHNDEEQSRLSLPEEFHISFYGIDKLPTLQVRAHYLSMFSQSHYLLPMVFPSFEKVVILDDDIVVQRDLSDLWSIEMGGKVISAVQSCSIRLSHLQNYLPSSSFDGNSCAWTSGINVIDLSRWRAHNVSETYQRLTNEMKNKDGGALSETSLLSASLLTFQSLVYPLDSRWLLSGLGHNYGVNSEALRNAAVLHFDGSMKPWLELGITNYKNFWRKFLNPESQFLNDCNVNQ